MGAKNKIWNVAKNYDYGGLSSDEQQLFVEGATWGIEAVIAWLMDKGNDYLINDRYQLPNGEMSRDWLKIKSDMFYQIRKDLYDNEAY